MPQIPSPIESVHPPDLPPASFSSAQAGARLGLRLRGFFDPPAPEQTDATAPKPADSRPSLPPLSPPQPRIELTEEDFPEPSEPSRNDTDGSRPPLPPIT